MTNSPYNLLLDIHSRGMWLHRSPVFYTMVQSLSSLITFWVLGHNSNLTTSLASAQHSHHDLQCPLAALRQHRAQHESPAQALLCTPCKRNLDVLWRFLILCPVQAFLPGNPSLEYGRHHSWHFRFWQKARLMLLDDHALSSCMSTSS